MPHVIIDDSQPNGEDEEVQVSFSAERKKMYRKRSPKERYFEKVVTGQTGCSSELGDIHRKQDMIQQLQDKLTMMIPGGRRAMNNNEKNRSQIKCAEINTYVRPYPKIVKARHMKLSVDGPAQQRSPTEVDEAPYEPRKKQSAQLPKTSLKSFSRNDEPDLFETVKAPMKRVTISNAAEATADSKSKQVLQQYQDVIFKPRRAITKSLDFNATAANMRLRNSGNQTQLEKVALASTST